MALTPCWRVLVLLGVMAAGTLSGKNTDRCKLLTENPSEKQALSLLEPLTNQNFTMKDSSGTETYTYVFQVCGDADGLKDAGLVQRKASGAQVRIGNYTAAEAIRGSDWVMLIYTGGMKYNNYCSQEERRAIVMISCDRRAVSGPLSVVLENKDRDKHCFYLFEMDSSAVCPAIESKLSAGTILLIVLSCSLAVYVIVGVLYQRLVLGAKGVGQFPHYFFWTEIGNLSADGCDLVCRSRGNRGEEEDPAYRGVATRPEEEAEERDDHLLPV